MISIRIPERTSIDDVLTWQLSSCEELRMSRRSGFEAGAQGLALSSLAALRFSRQMPVLECEFDEPTDLLEMDSTLLSSAFGFALIRLVSQINFAGTMASPRFKPLLGEFYKLKGGVFGSGSSRSIICADPVFPFPPALSQLDTASAVEFFPPPSVFATLLNNLVQEMGFRRLLASAEESNIVSFVYEAFRNSWEHGLPSEATRHARSTRALIIEKVVLKGNLTNRHLSSELKNYIERIADANKRELGLGIICLTVADQGDGIQTTLPSKSDLPEETDAQRLARAFLPGESRKPAGVVKRGLGLPSVVAAAHNLQGMIRIASRDLMATQDFSVGEQKYPSLNFDTISLFPEAFVCGTCVSIFVPEFAFDLDQRSLFAR